MQVVTTFIVFVVVLAGGAVAKGALFFIVAQTGRNRKPLEFCLSSGQLIRVITPLENGIR